MKNIEKSLGGASEEEIPEVSMNEGADTVPVEGSLEGVAPETPREREEKLRIAHEELEQAFKERRTLSDAELLKGGAKFERGVLQPTGEQIEAAHSEMRAEKGEYTSEEEKSFDGLIKSVVSEKEKPATLLQEILSIKPDKEKRPTLNQDVLLELMRLREINPSRFDEQYKPRIDWEVVRGAVGWDQKEYLTDPRKIGRFTEELSLIKELFPKEFEREMNIDDKFWGKIMKDAGKELHPEKRTFNFFAGMFADNIFRNGMIAAAGIKSLDKERFEKLRVTDEQVKRLSEMLENDRSSGRYSRDRSVERSLKILSKN